MSRSASLKPASLSSLPVYADSTASSRAPMANDGGDTCLQGFSLPAYADNTSSS